MFCAFTGGGTAGHIYPGLAVVDELKALCPELSFLWIGSSQGMDKHIVEESGSVDLFKGIASGKLRRYFSFKNFIDVFKIFFGFIASFFILLKYKPLFYFQRVALSLFLLALQQNFWVFLYTLMNVIFPLG